MIKKYNQFVKGRVNEDYDFEVESPVAPIDYTMGETENQLDNPTAEITLDSGDDLAYPEVEEEEEEGVNPYEKALEELADAAGVEFVKGSNKVIINGKEVTFPSEKYDSEKQSGSYQIMGIKGDFKTPNDVINAIDKKSVVKSTKEEEPSFEEPSFEETEGKLANNDLEDEMGAFESKSYKNTRLRKFRK